MDGGVEDSECRRLERTCDREDRTFNIESIVDPKTLERGTRYLRRYIHVVIPST